MKSAIEYAKSLSTPLKTKPEIEKIDPFEDYRRDVPMANKINQIIDRLHSHEERISNLESK